MKAVICTKYGTPEVLRMEEVAKPAPKRNEVLVKVIATTVNGADTRIRGAVFPSIVNIPVRLALGIRGPRKKILGVELAGIVESIGKSVTRFKPGDTVFASTGSSFGAHAEYTCISDKEVIALKPSTMSFEEAAAVPHCALAALYFLQNAQVRQDAEVLIYGASGGIGTFAVQIARLMGARVTGVCSTTSVQLVQSLGASAVVDYTKEDLAQMDASYDIIFDTVGKAPIKTCIEILNENGMYLSAVHLELSRILQGMKASRSSSKKVVGGVATYTNENLELLKEWIEAGKIKTVIDRIYPLEKIIEAHRYVDQGHKKGHVVVTMEQNGGQ